VVGFRGGRTLLMPLGELHGIDSALGAESLNARNCIGHDR